MDCALPKADVQSTSLQYDLPISRLSYVDDNIFINATNEGAAALCEAAKIELAKFGLQGNPDKDQKWSIQYAPHTVEQDWKKLKFLGSFIDTDTDLCHRIVCCRRIMSHYHKYVFKNRNASLEIKMKIFKGYILPILLFNSELW
eukprot:Platyproteum_vivax@DN4045_c1_g1_i1.p1